MAPLTTVRLRNAKTGVVVTTSEDNAARLSGFEPEKAPKTKSEPKPEK